MGKVIKIQINEKKGAKPVVVETCTATAKVGIAGDRHVAMDKRDVCIYRKELLDWMEKQEIQGLCFPPHKENLLVEGFADGEFLPGKRLVGEEVGLEISDFPEHCMPEECEFAKAGLRCLLREEYQMASIIKSGAIRTGEELTLR